MISPLDAGGVLRLATSATERSRSGLPCERVLQATPELEFGWPTPSVATSVPRGLIFGARRAFVIRTDSPRTRTSGAFSAGSLSGRVTDFGHNRVTIRLIRLT